METRPFILNASILDDRENTEAFRDDVQLNRIEFEFPKGLTTIPLLEECRALNNLEDFDFMYDITMQMLSEKPVLIYMKDRENKGRFLVAKFIVTCRDMDLRGVDFIAQYPIVVNWLAEFVAGFLRKKFPRPSLSELQAMDLKSSELPKAETVTA